MEWIAWLIIGSLFLLVIRKIISGRSEGNGSQKSSNRVISDEARDIASGINTISQFRALTKKLEKAEDRIYELSSERAIENATRKCEILEDAVNLAESIIFQWQFTPSAGIHTPSEVLNQAYKVFSIEEYKRIKSTLSNDDYDWYGIDGWGEKVDPEPEIKLLLKFRKIVEATEPKEEIVKKINSLVSNNKFILDEYLDPDSSLPPGDQWFAEEMQHDGLPWAYELYEEGYTTPEKCLDIDPKEFLSRRGVGPKTVEQLEQFQAKVRDRLANE